MNDITFGIIGGDLRFVRLCQLLVKKGFSISVYGLTHKDLPKNISICTSLEDLLCCKYIIGPIPFTKDNKTLNTPLSNVSISIDSFVNILKKHNIIAGAIGGYCKKLFNSNEISYTDLMDLNEVAILNAIPTAEGAIEYAMKYSEITLHGSNCLILGFGRCGKILAQKLHGLGANVSVEARSTTDLAFIKAYSYPDIALHQLNNHLNKFDFIFNTIPFIILDKELIDQISEDSFYIELASKPGGIDKAYCEKKGINYIPAASLPGKVAPTTAAQIIYKGILLILDKQEASL